MQASTTEEFDIMMTEIIDSALEKVMDRITDKIEEIIIKNTFGDPTPNTFYYNGSGQRTGQFEQSFNKRNVSKALRRTVKEAFYDWQSLGFEPSTSQNPLGLHSDLYGNDIREELADMLNQNDIVGGKVRREFWTEVEEWTKKNLHKMFREELAKYGVV